MFGKLKWLPKTITYYHQFPINSFYIFYGLWFVYTVYTAYETAYTLYSIPEERA